MINSIVMQIIGQKLSLVRKEVFFTQKGQFSDIATNEIVLNLSTVNNGLPGRVLQSSAQILHS